MAAPSSRSCEACGNLIDEAWRLKYFCESCCPVSVSSLDELDVVDLNVDQLKLLAEDLALRSRLVVYPQLQSATRTRVLGIAAIRFFLHALIFIALFFWCMSSGMAHFYQKAALGLAFLQFGLLFISSMAGVGLMRLSFVTTIKPLAGFGHDWHLYQRKLDCCFLIAGNASLIGIGAIAWFVLQQLAPSRPADYVIVALILTPGLSVMAALYYLSYIYRVAPGLLFQNPWISVRELVFAPLFMDSMQRKIIRGDQIYLRKTGHPLAYRQDREFQAAVKVIYRCLALYVFNNDSEKKFFPKS